MAAITQIRYQHSEGRAYYDKKIAEGKTPKEALRALKRQISDAIYPRLQADARRAAGQHCGPGRATGERLCLQRGRLTPRTPALRASHSRTCPHPTTAARPVQGRVPWQFPPDQEVLARAHARLARIPCTPGRARVPRAAGGRPWPARSSCPQGP